MLFSSKAFQKGLGSSQFPLAIKNVILQVLSMLLGIVKLRL
jgi:hypothetical protein